MLTSALAIHALLVLLCRFCKPDGLVMLLHIHDQSAESLIVVTCLWENAHMQYFVLVRDTPCKHVQLSFFCLKYLLLFIPPINL